jgi:hypothetical protein
LYAILSNPPDEPDLAADAHGDADYILRTPTSLPVRAHGPGGSHGTASVVVPPIAAGERRDVVLEIPAALDRRFWIRALAAEDRAPIQGALVRLRAGGPLVSSIPDAPKKPVISETRSRPDGLAEVVAPSWRGSLVEVSAPGYGIVLSPVVEGHDVATMAVDLLLERAASLEARILDRDGLAARGVTLRLRAPSARLTRPEGAVIVGNDPTWKIEPDADGRCLVPDLPASIPIAVEIRRGDEVVLEDPEPLVFVAGEVREKTWRLGAGIRIVGRAVEATGRGVPGIEIWIVAANPGGSAETTRYFRSAEAGQVRARATSDAAGAFRFEDVERGDYWIGPGASLTDGEATPAARARLLSLVGTEPEVEVEVVVEPGRTLTGHVFDPTGLPANACRIRAESLEGPGEFATSSTGDGSFSLGSLGSGEFLVRALGYDGSADSEPLRARAGDRGLVLRLARGGALRGRVVDLSTGEGVTARIMASGPALEPRRVGTESRGDAYFELTGLRAGTYDLVAIADDGRLGILRGIELASGAEVDSLSIAISPAAKLRVSCSADTSAGRLIVRSAGLVVGIAAIGKGLETTLTVPAGPLHVRIERARVAAGVEAVVELEAEGKVGEETVLRVP